MDNWLQLDLFKSQHADFIKAKKTRNDVRIGEAGEHLTLSKLQNWDINAFSVSAGDAYDIVADINGRMIRIQVKSTKRISSTMCFSFTRGFHGSKKGVFNYSNSDYDIAATANLVDEKVLFSYGVKNNISWSRHQFLTDGNEFASWSAAISFLSKH